MSRGGGGRGVRGVRGVRIMGGAARGRTVGVARGVRPTEGRVREALFSIWQERLPGARFLDLFAGSGAVGLEALSRGAASVLFVEGDPGALRELERSSQLFPPDRARRWRTRLPAGLGELAERARREWGPFDLVFADPPYTFTAHARTARRDRAAARARRRGRASSTRRGSSRRRRRRAWCAARCAATASPR